MQIFQLKITLRDIRPPIWRRIQVPADIKLGKLHRVIQDAMGWTDSHLHAFRVGTENYGVPDPNFGDDFRSERNMHLDSLVEEGGRLIYEYDFGDNWQHEILIEKALPVKAGMHYPHCLAGKRACPPDDCGGVWGYQNLLEILANPKHEEYEETLEWLGGEFNSEAFDLAEINSLLRRIKLVPAKARAEKKPLRRK